jgi:colanic acid/amylovoran biosynthesis protein
MRILVDSCSYNCQNVGDLSMLTVAVSRLRELWPNASIEVITNAPTLVSRHCGDVRTIPVRGRRLLLDDQLLGPARRLLPVGLGRRVDRAQDRLRLTWPHLFASSLLVKQKLSRRPADDAVNFLSAVEGADLVIVNGAGILTDAFKENALGILATLDLAQRRGKPTAMFGQGLGPIQDEELLARAATVLPRVNQICIRESRTGPALLSSLGVDLSGVVVTGDDAIEMAFPADRRDRLVSSLAIGINVRIAPYAAVDENVLALLGRVFKEAADRYHARMRAIPIAHHGGRMDVETLRQLLGDDDGAAALDTPRQVINRIGECRVMITGSYHGAVFALAQGIPVVALARSQYYVDKMAGVADQFGIGCEIVRLDADDLHGRLRAAIDRAWADADRVREPLLTAAADQIRRGRDAYNQLRSFVSAPPQMSSLRRSGVHSAFRYHALSKKERLL